MKNVPLCIWVYLAGHVRCGRAGSNASQEKETGVDLAVSNVAKVVAMAQDFGSLSFESAKSF